MKYRIISLTNYVLFLGIMYIVWLLTIDAKRQGGYDISKLEDIIYRLQEESKLRLIFDIDPQIFETQPIKEIVEQTFKKSAFEIFFEKQEKLNAGDILVNLVHSQDNSITFTSLQNITIKATNPAEQIKKNLKRFVNKFMPVIKDENPLQQQKFYLNRLFIFDILLQGDTQIEQVEITLIKLFEQFNLSKDNLQINYKYIGEIQKDEQSISYTSTSLQQSFNKRFKKHDMNWKDYSQINLIILNDERDLLFNNEKYDFIYQEPDMFVIKDNIYGSLFDIMMIVLQCEELTEIYLENSDYQPTIQLISQSFQKREQLRLYNNFIKELQFMEFIHNEGSYKITQESKQEYSNRLGYIIQCLEQYPLQPTSTANILIDDRFSDLDTFSFEYTMGIYLPIILPFAYPIILGIYDELKVRNQI